VSAREQRIAENEALFRDANERIVSKHARHDEALEIICECGDDDCLERLIVSADEYEQARSDPTLFLAKNGHIIFDVEEVVAKRPTHQLIRKTGDAAAVAEERDPRS